MKADLFVKKITLSENGRWYFLNRITLEVEAMEAQVETGTGSQRFPKQESPSLKGTLAGVLFIGGFILVTWFSIFFLFLSRN